MRAAIHFTFPHLEYTSLARQIKLECLFYILFSLFFSHWMVDWKNKKTKNNKKKRQTGTFVARVLFQTRLRTKASDEIRRKEACGARGEPIWEKPIRNAASPLSSFPVFSLHFGVTCWGDVKHVRVASFVRFGGLRFSRLQRHAPVARAAAVRVISLSSSEQMRRWITQKQLPSQSFTGFVLYKTRLKGKISLALPLAWSSGVAFCGVNSHLV